MPGRPIARAKKFGEWEDKLWELFTELREMTPHRPPDQQQGLHEPDCWIEAYRHLDNAVAAAGEVRAMLEEKAGLDAAELDAERCELRGMWDLQKGRGVVA